MKSLVTGEVTKDSEELFCTKVQVSDELYSVEGLFTDNISTFYTD